MRISVVVPTYRRVADLNRCLSAIENQATPPDEIVAVVRRDDTETLCAIASREKSTSTLKTVHVSEPGVIAAMNAGLSAASGSIIALTDDDGAPWPDWIARIRIYFRDDPKLGAIGGKDWQRAHGTFVPDKGSEDRAGELQWWGRVIGDHHLATPSPMREVSVVKGVNVAFRREALQAVDGFDTRLLGTGAQVHWELSVCLALKRAGWKVMFDPSLSVDHYPAVRFDEDQRGRFNSLAQRNMVHNETLVLCEHLSVPRRFIFIGWAFLLGTRGSPGLAQIPRLLLQRQSHVIRRWACTVIGRFEGIKAALYYSQHSADAP